MFSEGVPLLAEHGVAIYAGEAQTPAWAESRRSLRELLTGFIEPPQPPHYLALLVWLIVYPTPTLIRRCTSHRSWHSFCSLIT
jgi:hypothetical protein